MLKGKSVKETLKDETWGRIGERKEGCWGRCLQDLLGPRVIQKNVIGVGEGVGRRKASPNNPSRCSLRVRIKRYV